MKFRLGPAVESRGSLTENTATCAPAAPSIAIGTGIPTTNGGLKCVSYQD
jgi:hypothetical protein